MPIVPRINPAPLPGVRVGGGAPDAAFGGGAGNVTAGLNPGLSAVHQAAAGIAQEEKVRADQIALTDAGAQASSAMTDTLYGPNGALNRKGKDAFTAPEDARSAYFGSIGQIRAGLGNDDQRAAFDRIVANDWGRINEQVQRHVAQQRVAYDTDATDALVANKQNEALNSYTDPTAVEAAIAAQKGAIAGYGARNGWDNEQTTQAVAKQVSKTRFDVLSRMLDSEQDLAAASYFQAHRDDFAGDDLLRAEKLVDASSVRGKSQQLADQITAGGPAGLLTAGNIDLTNRPRVTNPDGSVSTVRSMSIERDGKEILIPTVSDGGKLLTDDEAVAEYDRTGKHLGIFATAAAADAYAEQLHEAQAAMLEGRGNGEPPKAAATLASALAQVQQIADPRVRDATEQRVRRSFEDKVADQRQRRATANAAAEQVLKNTRDFNQIPLGVQNDLEATDVVRLKKIEDDLRHPKVRTNISAFSHLVNYLSINESTRAAFPDEFNKLRDQLSDEDQDYLIKLWGSTTRGDERATDASTRRIQQREETTVIKTADQARKVDQGTQALRDRMKAQGKSDADINKILPPSKAPSVVVPKWMTDSAANDPEYASYLRSHSVPIAQPAAAASSTSSGQPLPDALNPNISPFSTTPAPQRPRVAGAPLPARSALNPAAFGLSSQQPSQPQDIGDQTARIAGGRPVVLHQNPITPGTPGEYRPPTIASKGDTIYLGHDANVPESFIKSHEMAHFIYQANDAEIPPAYRSSAVSDPGLAAVIAKIKSRKGATAPTEEFSRAFAEAMRSVYGTPAFGPDSSSAHQANKSDVKAITEWIRSRDSSTQKR